MGPNCCQFGRHLGRRRRRNIPLNAKVTDAITITQKSDYYFSLCNSQTTSQKRDSILLRAGQKLAMYSSSVAEHFPVLRHRMGRNGQPCPLAHHPGSVLDRKVF